MDMKITGQYAVYQSVVNGGRKTEKDTAVQKASSACKKTDEICISNDAVRKKEAAGYSAAVRRTLDDTVSEDRIASLKQQIADGTYQVSAGLVARKLMSGL